MAGVVLPLLPSARRDPTGEASNGYLSNRFLMWLGTISYGVYLLHQLILGWVFHFLSTHEPSVSSLSEAPIVCVALVLTLALAGLSWKYFEKPLLGIGHSLKY